MERAYEYRIYPNAEQRAQIERTFGCRRWVWNRCLAERIALYDEVGKAPSGFDQMKELPRLKQQEDTSWLGEADSVALVQAIRDLDRAYANFFRRLKKGGRPGFPRFKSKRTGRQTYRTGGAVSIVDSKHVRLPKLGSVKARVSRMPEGRILSATVKRVPSGKYFVVLCCADCPEPKMPPGPIDMMGVDVGVRCLLARSDGVLITNPKGLRKAEKRLAREQRRLSRKEKGSANREKQRRRVATVHERVANRRKDALHKATTDAVRESQAIAVEDLKVAPFLRNTGEAREIPRHAERRIHAAFADASMGELVRQVEYKCEWYGRGFVKVDPAGTSETCSRCGHVQDMPLSRQVYRCPECGLALDRDVNAAVNIAREGRRILEGTVGHTGTASPELANACGAGIRPALP